MRHEEAGAFAAGAEAQFTGRLTACAGSCGPGSLHFINGLYEANHRRAPVVLIATQIVRQDIGFQSIQEVDFKEVYQGLQRLLRHDPDARPGAAENDGCLPGGADEARRRGADRAGGHRQRGGARRGCRMRCTRGGRSVRPDDADLDEIAAILNASERDHDLCGGEVRRVLTMKWSPRRRG